MEQVRSGSIVTLTRATPSLKLSNGSPVCFSASSSACSRAPSRVITARPRISTDR
jgi:hypothetical protein